MEITSLAYGGDGIGRIDGQVCFVPFAFPGDVLEVAVVRKAKGVLWAGIKQILQPSPDRVAGLEGPHAGRCGGCHWIQFAYPAQGVWKLRLVTEALARYAGIEANLTWQEDPAQRTGWRTRADIHGDGKLNGFFAPGTHEVVGGRCPLLHPRLAAAVDRLRRSGWRGEVTVTINPDGDDVLAFGRGVTDDARKAVTAWDGPHSEPPRARFHFDGVPIVNGCFSQAGLLLNRMLRKAVADCVQADGPLFDAYCGNGNLSLAFTGSREVAGMDIAWPAAAAARDIAGEYREGGESDIAAAILGRAWGTVVLDPPRTGAKALLSALADARAEEIVYVSCDPVALARDLKAIANGGWRIERGTVLDLFPNTSHVETVVRLVRG